ncbi:prepilin peptidase [Serinibacter salmoneus]|uniref:Leader peptidase (Prepilin peptidase)/N-methyltransferase n=1 Tax=Serinibacter salmoneus TaxID=556530 RepID=A0A2A9CZS1_9MICO|nr:A24 family peptidase [Serinibacter salmoneus]PFG19631.1 leader peptidase (prepilin peptidase)/N-methyltransferase [Serinibacter salmoneus]
MTASESVSVSIIVAVAAAVLSALAVWVGAARMAGLAHARPAPWYLRRPWAPLLTGATTGLSALTVVPALGWAALGCLVIVATAAAACLVDLAAHRLPDVLVLRGWVAGIVLVALGCLAQQDLETLLRAVVASAGTWSLLAALAWLYPPGLGFGDVKLAGALAVVTGAFSITAPVLALALAFLTGGVTALVLLVLGQASRGTAIPFGPVLLAGTLAALTMPVW